jgi:ABC transporter substrate binding protein
MELVRGNAASLIERKPDAIIALGGRVIPILKQMTRSVPIVAVTVDLVGTGIVASLAHPGENITGFCAFSLRRTSFAHGCVGAAAKTPTTIRFVPTSSTRSFATVYR